jgi:hypothetical protein
MKNKMLVILMVGIVVATGFGAMSASAVVISKEQEVKTVSPFRVDEGTMSASAVVISKEQEVKTVSPLDVEEIGDIGAAVFDITSTEAPGKHPEENCSMPVIQFITDATVFCKDINGDTHDMEYVEYTPEKYFYIAYEVPAGPCEITASKQGYGTETISGQVVAYGFTAYKIEMEKDGEKHRVFLRLLDILPTLRLLLKL